MTRHATAVWILVHPPFQGYLLLFGQQIPQRKIIDDILHILDPVLEPVTPTAQAVVLQVQDLEASKQILDKLIDQQRALVVTKSDGVACKTRLCNRQRSCAKLGVRFAHQLFHERDEGLQVLLEREVKLVALLQVDRDCVMY